MKNIIEEYKNAKITEIKVGNKLFKLIISKYLPTSLLCLLIDNLDNINEITIDNITIKCE
jgi:hypothetical protein